jgi:hypothetical protein
MYLPEENESMNRPIGGGSKWFSVLAAEGDDEKPVVYQRLVTGVVRINETRCEKEEGIHGKGR